MNPLRPTGHTVKRREKRGRKLRPRSPAYEGFLKPIPIAQLPTYRDVGLAVEYFKHTDGVKEQAAVDQVIKDIVRVYEIASIPTICRREIKKKMGQLLRLKREKLSELKFDKRRSASRVQGKRRKKSKNGKTKSKLSDVLSCLFNIADEARIPAVELSFFVDQKTARKMMIGGLDMKVTAKNKRKMERVDKQKQRKEREEERKATTNISGTQQWMGLRDVGNRDEQYDEGNETKGRQKKRKREDGDEWEECEGDRRRRGVKKRRTQHEFGKIGSIFETAERFGLTDMATAHMVNQVCTTEGLITLADKGKVLTRRSVNRLRKKQRMKKVENSKGKSVIAIGFDERKDETKVEAGKGLKGSKRYETRRVENCAIVFWPGEEFAGHVVPKEATGKSLADGIYNFLKSRETDVGSLRAVLSDACAKMTGPKSGVQAELEKLLQRPLQGIVCFLHHLEKPFEKIFQEYDGATSGPKSFRGPIGQIIVTDIWKREVVKYQPMKNPELLSTIRNIPDELLKTLSKDHVYLIKMCEAVLTGEVSVQWAEMRAGPVVQSRWTNTQA